MLSNPPSKLLYINIAGDLIGRVTKYKQKINKEYLPKIQLQKLTT
jgi:hypothetical protein